VGSLPVDQAGQKALAARRAAEEVRDGMVVGLGTGSTAALFLQALAERMRQGLRVVGVATSEATATQARRLGIPLVTLEDRPTVDLDADGADEVAPGGELLKGLGGALLREKIVAAAARRLLIMVDEGKLVRRLGEKAPVPVEVVRFGWRRTAEALRSLGAEPALRGGEADPFVTDGGNYILDCRFPAGTDLAALAPRIKALVGVVEHGLFLGMRPTVFIGHADGTCEVRLPGGATR
jgi:ribose 5-phosphate isomerase A